LIIGNLGPVEDITLIECAMKLLQVRKKTITCEKYYVWEIDVGDQPK